MPVIKEAKASTYQFLPPAFEQNFTITIGKLTLDELWMQIRNTTVDPKVIRGLSGLLNEDIVKKIEGADLDALTMPIEQFLKKLDLTLVSVLVQRIDFFESIESITLTLNSLVAVLTQIRNSSNLENLLKQLLTYSNILNQTYTTAKAFEIGRAHV